MACAMRPKFALAARAPSAVRPSGLTCSFVAPCPTASMFSSFAGLSITAPRQVSISRPLVIMNNAKKCMGATSEGSNRKTKTTSGFRTRKATPTGRRVLKQRRKKGRKILCPASVRKDGKNRI